MYIVILLYAVKQVEIVEFYGFFVHLHVQCIGIKNVVSTATGRVSVL